MQDSAAEAVEPRTMDKLGDADTAGFAWRKMAGLATYELQRAFQPCKRPRLRMSNFIIDIYKYFGSFAIPLARIAQW